MATLYERLESTDRGSAALSSARLRRTALAALYRALESAGMSQAELSRRLGVRRSAVNQVFRGDGNLRLETLAEYLHGMGVEADLRLAPLGELRSASTELREPRYLARRQGVEASAQPNFVSIFRATAVTDYGVGQATVVAMSDTDPADFLEEPTHEVTIRMKDGAIRRGEHRVNEPGGRDQAGVADGGVHG